MILIGCENMTKVKNNTKEHEKKFSELIHKKITISVTPFDMYPLLNYLENDIVEREQKRFNDMINNRSTDIDNELYIKNIKRINKTLTKKIKKTKIGGEIEKLIQQLCNDESDRRAKLSIEEDMLE